MEIYLDNSATTRCSDSVCDAVVRAMTQDYGNPSSRHLKGVEAERLLRQSRETIARTLRAAEKEIFFTSGGTESDNWALIGTAMANRRSGMHLITTGIEHAAVLRPMQYLEDQGFRVTYLPVDSKGLVDLEDLKDALTDGTILVSMMTVNNEIGTRLPVEEAAALVKAFNPGIVFHTDAVQAYGKYRLSPGRSGIDLLSVSGHKIHGPKGTGFLYVKEKTRILPFILGGGQQKGMRSGTDNVPGAAGLAQAAADCYENLQEETEHLRELKQMLSEGLRQMDDVVLHSDEDGAPHIVSASFVGVRSEVMLHALEDRGIYVSSGSACSSNRKLPVSPVLEQLHLPRQQLESTLRFSFSRYNTKEDVTLTLQALDDYLPILRRYTRH